MKINLYSVMEKLVKQSAKYAMMKEAINQNRIIPIQNKRNKIHIPEADRWAVWKRDNFTCKRCGAREYLTIDHIIPKSKGGSNNIDNYQTLCKTCNSKKGIKDG